MTLFYIAALAMALIAGASILWPLIVKGGASGLGRGDTNVSIYKGRKAELDSLLATGDLDEQSHQAMIDELNLSLLSDTESELEMPVSKGNNSSLWVLLMAAVMIPVLAGTWYWSKGASEEVALRDLMQTMQGPDDALKVVASLRRSLEKDPENTQNWFMLARMYMELGRYSDATMAYLEIVNRESEASEVVAEMAQALFLASNNQVTPEVRRINERALKLDPNNGTSLGLAGIDAYEQKDYGQAITYWQKAMAQAAPGSSAYQALQGGVARAKEAIGTKETVSDQTVAGVELKQEGVKPVLRVAVSMGAQVPVEGQTLFVYARAWQGAKMPLAIQRLSVGDLPLTVTLDDSMAMMAGTSLATAGPLEVIARLSASGSPAPQSGDWQASAGPISLAQGSVSLNLEIATQVP